MKKKIIATVLAMAMVGVMAGCGSSNDSASSDSSDASEETSEETEEAADESEDEAEDTADSSEAGGDDAFTFGFVTLADSDVWCKSVCTAFEEYVAATYPNCRVVTADGNADANVQIQAIENFIAQGVDVLVLQPADADATAPGIEEANDQGIPVITTAIKSNAGEYTYVGPENLEAGKAHAEYIMENCEPGCKILYLQGTAGLSHSTDRYNGFIDTLDEAGFDYELLAAQDGDYLRSEGLRITEDWIQKYPEFDAIVSSNDEMALGAVQALKSAGKEGVVVLGLDASDDAREAIREGSMTASLKQDAVAIADTSADLAYKAAQGEEIEDTYIAWVMIDASNVDVD